MDDILNDSISLTNYLNDHTGRSAMPEACKVTDFINMETRRSADSGPDLELLFFGVLLLTQYSTNR